MHTGESGETEDVLATVVYNVRGRTWHTDQTCKRGARNELTLRDVTDGSQWNACTECALHTGLLRLAAAPGEKQYVWVRTWDVDDDAEEWQRNPERRERQAEALWAVGEAAGLRVQVDPEDPENVQVMGKVPPRLAVALTHNYPVTLGPAAGWEPSHEVLEVFRVLAEDDGTQHGDRSRLEELWEIARCASSGSSLVPPEFPRLED